jgi:two-component system, NtrC family, sensor kinase
MKIERKIIVSNGFTMLLIVLIGLMGYQNLNVILTKLRFIEIASDLNAGLLEMRLSEKNFFLYGDSRELLEMDARLIVTKAKIIRSEAEIVPAIGEKNFAALLARLHAYAAALHALRSGGADPQQAGAELRAKGQALREYSIEITEIEHKTVNEIVSTSYRIMFLSFAICFVLALAVSYGISQGILRSLRQIGAVAHAISRGNFQRIDATRSGDEIESVITAINSMSEELEKREEQLIQSKKLASLGILTAGVTHELTNPVNNISMIAQNFLELYDKLPREKQLDMVSQIDGETARIKSVITNLLNFSKPQGTKLARADLNAIIRKTMGLVQNMLHVSDIGCELELAGTLPPVYVDEHQIQQVLVNLIVNAVQAMQAHGRLAIGTRAVADESKVEFTVSDNGKGIPPEYLSNVFDPFFSTKGVEGTGLGLSVSYGIIKNLSGEIRVQSEVGTGTTFTVSLPSG